MSVRFPHGVAPDVSPPQAGAPLRRHLADLLPLGAAFGLLAALGVAACAPAAGPVGGGTTLVGVVPGSNFPQPVMISSVNGVLDVRLAVDTATLDIPTRGPSLLRTYRLLAANGVSYADSNKVGFPGPTFRVAPGDRVRIKLLNRLPWTADDRSDGCVAYFGSVAQQNPNPPPAILPPTDSMPNCFHRPNWTNIHFHGFHVSPDSGADNVLMEIAPQDSFQYDFGIPHNQSPGTHWYHPHKHGSVALQVLNGMSGAFIVADPATGLDSITRAHGMREFLMAVQQVDTQLNLVLADSNATGPAMPLVNGQATPTLRLYPGEVARLRIVNENVHSTANYKVLVPDTSFRLFDIARDGVAYAPANYDTIHADQNLFLSPGNRLDVYIRAPLLRGAYVLSAQRIARENGERRRIVDADTVPRTFSLANIHVIEPGIVGYNMVLPGTLPPLPSFLQNLAGNTRDTAVVVFSDSIPPAGRTHLLPTQFWLGSGTQPRQRLSNNVFIPTNRLGDTVPMRLGQTQTWMVVNYSTKVNHPFHIHINPFQVVSVSAPASGDGFAGYYQTLNAASGGPASSPVWLDVLPLPLASTDAGGRVVPGVAIIRQKYDDFDGCTTCGNPFGSFVMHCHILGHEERGMMQIIRILGPGEPVPTSSAGGGHHHH
jgi:FtsP/CotA-like multicopper oxidase with cupredoxin domain